MEIDVYKLPGDPPEFVYRIRELQDPSVYICRSPARNLVYIFAAADPGIVYISKLARRDFVYRKDGSSMHFVESLFSPILQFLDLMIGKLNGIAAVSAKGIRLDNYFGVFGVLGPSWARVINSLLASLIFLFILYMIQKYSGVLLWFKSLIKWW